jgi:hydrogenase maturation protease
MEATALPQRSSVLVIGLGNELLTDDGAGISVMRRLKERLPRNDVTFEELSIGGLHLLDHLVGYQRCVLIDAVVSGVNPPGTIYRLIQRPGDEPICLSSSHHVDLPQVLALGRMLGADLPSAVVVYGIEACDTTTFSESCTDAVASAIPQLVELICRDIQEGWSTLLRDEGCGEIASQFERQ